MNYAVVEPVIDLSVRGLCVRPYTNHPQGCPNFDKKSGCPPSAPTITDTLNLHQPIYAIWNRFDFSEHVERMRKLHPKWSQRQCECCLYWQGSARKQLRNIIAGFLAQYRGLVVIACPEAQGVNVTETIRRIGIDLEWPPQNHTYQIVLAGSKGEAVFTG